MTDPHPETTANPANSWRGYFWPGFVIVLLAGQVLLLLIMVYVAVSDRSFAVEPDYYQKGLHWDDIAAQRRLNDKLGWQVTIQLGAPTGPLAKREFQCVLTDREGSPLNDAIVDLIAFPHARGSERDLVMLEPGGDGTYVAPMRFRRKGLWEFRFVIRKEADVFTHVVRQDVYPPGESRPWRP